VVTKDVIRSIRHTSPAQSPAPPYIRNTAPPQVVPKYSLLTPTFDVTQPEIGSIKRSPPVGFAGWTK